MPSVLIANNAIIQFTYMSKIIVVVGVEIVIRIGNN